MASSSGDPGPSKSARDASEPLRNVADLRAPALEWPELTHRCEALGITMRELQLEQSSIDGALAAIKDAKRGSKWEHKQRQKLRKRVVRAIEDAEAARGAHEAEPSGTEHAGSGGVGGASPPPRPPPQPLSLPPSQQPRQPSQPPRPSQPQPLQPQPSPQPMDVSNAPRMSDLDAALDAMDAEELAAFVEWRHRPGMPGLDDDMDVAAELRFVADWRGSPEYEAAVNPPTYTTTYAEFLEHCGDHCGGRQRAGESDEDYRQRLCESLSERTEPLPPPPPSMHLDGQTDDYFDGGADDTWCMSCHRERPGERGLSYIKRELCYCVANARGQLACRHVKRVMLQYCKRCQRELDQL